MLKQVPQKKRTQHTFCHRNRRTTQILIPLIYIVKNSSCLSHMPEYP